MKTIKTKYKAVSIASIALLVPMLTAYGLVALTATANVTVSEPLSITAASGVTGATCIVAGNGLTASCVVASFAGDVSTLQITVANAANAAVSVTATAISNNANVTVTAVESTAVIPASSTHSLVFNLVVSQSARPLETAVVLLSFSR